MWRGSFPNGLERAIDFEQTSAHLRRIRLTQLNLKEAFGVTQIFLQTVKLLFLKHFGRFE